MNSQDLSVSVKHYNQRVEIVFNHSETVGVFKHKLSRRLRVPQEHLSLIWAGVKLENDRRLSDFSLSSGTVLHAITETNNRSIISNINAPTWTRSKYTPLPEVSPPVLTFENLPVENVPIFIWCEKTVHNQLKNETDNYSFPEQVQPASIRFQCAECGSEALKFDGSRVNKWTDILISPSPFHGHCFNCKSKQAIKFVFKCKGERMTKKGAQTLCNEYSPNSFVLPNIVNNKNMEESVDTLNADSYQIQFTGCKCRYNASTFTGRFSTIRNYMVKNNTQPELLGNYILRCFTNSPECGFAYRPTLRILGHEVYQRLRDWQAIETTLALEGVQCPVCLQAFIPAGAGPKSTCPSCGEICEMHRGKWGDCERKHTDSCVCSFIDSTATEGSGMQCPKCHIFGQKDENCTHIQCSMCQTPWCYFCGSVRKAKLACPKGCPQFFSRYTPTRPTTNARNTDISRGMEKFHKLRTTRLLYLLRNNNPSLFDNCFLNHLKFPNNCISISVELCTRTNKAIPITLEEIVTYRPPTCKAYPHSVP